MPIPTHVTTTYPTRYAAFANPNNLMILSADEEGRVWTAGHVAQPFASWIATKGRELAVFHEPTRNPYFPACSDGVYIEVTSTAGTAVVVRLEVSAPTPSRLQWSKVMSAPSLAVGLTHAASMIEEARGWVADRMQRETLLTIGGRRFALLTVEEGKEVELSRLVSSTPVAIAKAGEVVFFEPLTQRDREAISASLVALTSPGYNCAGGCDAG